MIKSASQSSLVNDVKYTSMAAGAVPSNEYLIETIEIGATPLASIIFNNLSQWSGIYRHFQIVSSTRNTSTAGGAGTNYGANGLIRFNGDSTGGAYRAHYVQGDGSNVASGEYGAGNNGAYVPDLGGVWDSHTANAYATVITDILDPFNSSKNTTIRSLTGFVTGGKRVTVCSSAWFNTAPVSSITIVQDGTAFKTGSRFSLYGVTA